MNVKEENICRLCFNIVENDFVEVDDVIKEMFDVLLLNVNLHISENPVLCQECAEVTQNSFYFKSICMNTKNLILSFADDKTGSQLELKDIYKDGENLESVGDDYQVCRFCIKRLESDNFVSMDTLMNEAVVVKMWPLYMQQMDCNIIKNPVICIPCREDLECYFSFVQNCLNIEEKINRYVTNSKGKVKLNSILQSLCNDTMEIPDKCSQFPVTEQEAIFELSDTDSEICDDLVNGKEVLDIKFEEVNLSEESCQRPSEIIVDQCDDWYACKINDNTILSDIMSSTIHKDFSKVETYKCALCSFETRYKRILQQHLRTHGSEVGTYKCPVCPYESKYKGYMKRHMPVHEVSSHIKMHKCAQCPFQAKRKYALKIHMFTHENVYKPPKPVTAVEMYKCEMCTYTAKQKNTLKEHMIIHKDASEIEMYRCAMCPYVGVLKRNIKAHVLMHKDASEVKMFKCATCPFETKRKKCLKNHMLTHRKVSQAVTAAQ